MKQKISISPPSSSFENEEKLLSSGSGPEKKESRALNESNSRLRREPEEWVQQVPADALIVQSVTSFLG